MSQGGFLSMRAALTAPERVSGLIFIDSAADVDDPETLEGNKKMVEAFAGGDDETRSFVFDVVGKIILGDERLEADWKPIWAELDAEQLQLAGATLLGREDLVDRLGEISCPTLVIHGTEDAGISLDRGYLLANGVRDSRGVVEVAGAAHAPNMTHPNEVNLRFESSFNLSENSASNRGSAPRATCHARANANNTNCNGNRAQDTTCSPAGRSRQSQVM